MPERTNKNANEPKILILGENGKKSEELTFDEALLPVINHAMAELGSGEIPKSNSDIANFAINCMKDTVSLSEAQEERLHTFLLETLDQNAELLENVELTPEQAAEENAEQIENAELTPEQAASQRQQRIQTGLRITLAIVAGAATIWFAGPYCAVAARAAYTATYTAMWGTPGWFGYYVYLVPGREWAGRLAFQYGPALLSGPLGWLGHKALDLGMLAGRAGYYVVSSAGSITYQGASRVFASMARKRRAVGQEAIPTNEEAVMLAETLAHAIDALNDFPLSDIAMSSNEVDERPAMLQQSINTYLDALREDNIDLQTIAVGNLHAILGAEGVGTVLSFTNAAQKWYKAQLALENAPVVKATPVADVMPVADVTPVVESASVGKVSVEALDLAAEPAKIEVAKQNSTWFANMRKNISNYIWPAMTPEKNEPVVKMDVEITEQQLPHDEKKPAVLAMSGAPRDSVHGKSTKAEKWVDLDLSDEPKVDVKPTKTKPTKGG